MIISICDDLKTRRNPLLRIQNTTKKVSGPPSALLGWQFFGAVWIIKRDHNVVHLMYSDYFKSYVTQNVSQTAILDWFAPTVSIKYKVRISNISLLQGNNIRCYRINEYIRRCSQNKFVLL